MPETHTHILYSYRRCPYAMRARMALRYAHIAVEIREISLRDKPKQMLAISPKGTVPVLQMDSGEVIEESLLIMQWALAQHDPEDWLLQNDANSAATAMQLIAQNDGDFKKALDRYKYPDRYPDFSQIHYRNQGRAFLQMLEDALQLSPFLLHAHPSLADVAIFPFIRQFAAVDADWFAQAPYPQLQKWLNYWLNSALFSKVMEKYPTWQGN